MYLYNGIKVLTKLKETLNEMDEMISSNVLHHKNSKEGFYWVGQKNLLDEIRDVLSEIEKEENDENQTWTFRKRG